MFALAILILADLSSCSAHRTNHGTPPTTTASIIGTKDRSGNYISPVQITLKPTSKVSNVVLTTIRDNGDWSLYPDAQPYMIRTPGPHTITYYSQDAAGNIEQTKTLSLTITPDNSH